MDLKKYSIRNIDWGKFAKTTKEVLVSIGQGNFLIRMGIHKLFPYILVLFLLGMLNIVLNYVTEQAALKVEKNNVEIETLKIYHSHMNGEIVELNRISTIEQMLQEAGSEVKIPEKPADRIR